MTTQPIDASLLREDEREMLERAEKATLGPWEQVNDHVYQSDGNEQVAACDFRKRTRSSLLP